VVEVVLVVGSTVVVVVVGRTVVVVGRTVVVPERPLAVTPPSLAPVAAPAFVPTGVNRQLVATTPSTATTPSAAGRRLRARCFTPRGSARRTATLTKHRVNLPGNDEQGLAGSRP
jgi:hypothetical protein